MEENATLCVPTAEEMRVYWYKKRKKFRIRNKTGSLAAEKVSGRSNSQNGQNLMVHFSKALNFLACSACPQKRRFMDDNVYRRLVDFLRIARQSVTTTYAKIFPKLYFYLKKLTKLAVTSLKNIRTKIKRLVKIKKI